MMELQAKRKSLWSTFKNAYLRSTNVKKFWSKLNKDKIPSDLVNTFNLYLNSESYNWSSKCWKHLTINHLNLMKLLLVNEIPFGEPKAIWGTKGHVGNQRPFWEPKGICK